MRRFVSMADSAGEQCLLSAGALRFDHAHGRLRNWTTVADALALKMRT